MSSSTARIPSLLLPLRALPTLSATLACPLAANDTRAPAPAARPVVLTPTPLPPPAAGCVRTASACRRLPRREGYGGGS
jgi:hypothetical protein